MSRLAQMAESEVTPLRKPWKAQMLLKCVCIVTQSATQARGCHPAPHCGWYTQSHASAAMKKSCSPTTATPILCYSIYHSLWVAAVFWQANIQNASKRMSNKGVPTREKSGSQIALQLPFHLFKQKWLKWRETGKTRLLHPKHTNYSWEDWEAWVTGFASGIQDKEF